MRDRLLLVALICVFVALAVPAAARSDGDPASDVLVISDVFLSSPPPSKDAVAPLQAAVSAVYARRLRIKVALVASSADLGAVPELFGKPKAYAKFLGAELDPFFVGPLLVVMPQGFGAFDGDRPTTAEDRVLAGLSVGGSSPEALAQSATAAVRALQSAHALASPDIRPPIVYPRPATAHRGAAAKLSYTLLEDSEWTKETVTIRAGKSVVKIIRSPFRRAVFARPHSVIWHVPASLHTGTLRLCIVATDPAGNHSVPACEPLKVR